MQKKINTGSQAIQTESDISLEIIDFNLPMEVVRRNNGTDQKFFDLLKYKDNGGGKLTSYTFKLFQCPSNGDYIFRDIVAAHVAHFFETVQQKRFLGFYRNQLHDELKEIRGDRFIYAVQGKAKVTPLQPKEDGIRR